MSEIQLQIKEATGADAKAVLAVSQQLGEETDFLLMDESGLALPEALLAEQLDAIYERDDYLLLLAFDQEQLIAMASVKGHEEWQLAHVGEIGISILNRIDRPSEKSTSDPSVSKIWFFNRRLYERSGANPRGAKS